MICPFHRSSLPFVSKQIMAIMGWQRGRFDVEGAKSSKRRLK